MASNPMQKKSRNAFLLGMLLMLIIAAIAMIAMFLLLTKNNKKEEEEQVAQKTVYRVSKEIKSGGEIEDSCLELVQVNENMIPSNAYGPNDLGYLYRLVKDENNEEVEVPKYKAKVDLLPGTVLSESMIYEGEALQASERIQEYNMLQLPIQLEPDEYVDVRLQLSNGQDYIVVSHKKVIDITDTTIWLQMKEEEIVLLSNAMVEAYISPATNLYVTKYVEPGMQGAATITYIPSTDVITLIERDENIINTAKSALITKYNNNADLRGNIVNEINKYAEDGLENIQAQMDEAREKALAARQEYLYGIN